MIICASFVSSNYVSGLLVCPVIFLIAGCDVLGKTNCLNRPLVKWYKVWGGGIILLSYDYVYLLVSVCLCTVNFLSAP